MKNLHKFVLVAVVAALLAFALGACKATTNTLARWGGAATGAVVGGAVAGPGGAAVGAVAGDAGGDALVEDPPVVVIENHAGGVVNSAALHAGPAGVSWVVWLCALVLGVWLLVPRTRGHFLGSIYAALHGHVLSALAKAGALLGVIHSERANATLTAARRRRGKTPPAVIVSGEVKPHA